MDAMSIIGVILRHLLRVLTFGKVRTAQLMISMSDCLAAYKVAFENDNRSEMFQKTAEFGGLSESFRGRLYQNIDSVRNVAFINFIQMSPVQRLSMLVEGNDFLQNDLAKATREGYVELRKYRQYF